MQNIKDVFGEIDLKTRDQMAKIGAAIGLVGGTLYGLSLDDKELFTHMMSGAAYVSGLSYCSSLFIQCGTKVMDYTADTFSKLTKKK